MHIYTYIYIYIYSRRRRCSIHILGRRYWRYGRWWQRNVRFHGTFQFHVFAEIQCDGTKTLTFSWILSLTTFGPVTPGQDECACECKTPVASRFAAKARASHLSCSRPRRELRQVIARQIISLARKNACVSVFRVSAALSLDCWVTGWR